MKKKEKNEISLTRLAVIKKKIVAMISKHQAMEQSLSVCLLLI